MRVTLSPRHEARHEARHEHRNERRHEVSAHDAQAVRCVDRHVRMVGDSGDVQMMRESSDVLTDMFG